MYVHQETISWENVGVETTGWHSQGLMIHHFHNEVVKVHPTVCLVSPNKFV